MNSYTNIWSVSGAGTSNATTTLTYPTMTSPYYAFHEPIYLNRKSVSKKLVHEFPFKKSPNLKLSAQLQGHFDNWAGSIRKEIFNG
jgi:hypothetical protein